jgi:hypothetical protein
MLNSTFITIGETIECQSPSYHSKSKTLNLSKGEYRNEMLKQVQHDNIRNTLNPCHPELGPELDSGSIEFGIWILILVRMCSGNSWWACLLL